MFPGLVPAIDPTDTPRSYRLKLALFCIRYVSDHGAIATGSLDDVQLEQAADGLNEGLTLGWSRDGMVVDVLSSTLTFVRAMLDGRRARQAAPTSTQSALLSADTHTPGSKPVPRPPLPAPIIPPVRQLADMF